jgi:hypothetical protein
MNRNEGTVESGVDLVILTRQHAYLLREQTIDRCQFALDMLLGQCRDSFTSNNSNVWDRVSTIAMPNNIERRNKSRRIRVFEHNTQFIIKVSAP